MYNLPEITPELFIDKCKGLSIRFDDSNVKYYVSSSKPIDSTFIYFFTAKDPIDLRPLVWYAIRNQIHTTLNTRYGLDLPIVKQWHSNAYRQEDIEVIIIKCLEEKHLLRTSRFDRVEID